MNTTTFLTKNTSRWTLWQFLLLIGIGFSSQTSAQVCTNTTSALAKWDFNSQNMQCNGAYFNGDDLTNPTLSGGLASYCPNTNNGCGITTLGSKGHQNTPQYSYALCLFNFYNVEAVLAKNLGAYYDPNSTTFDPEGKANLFVKYKLPKNKPGCLQNFAVQILQPQFNGTSINFEKQGVAVKRNGVLIYSQTQPILASNINATPITTNFTGSDFCSDGTADVEFEIIFGLVHRLTGPGLPGTATQVGYDNITVNGFCTMMADVTASTCNPTGSNNDAKITLYNFTSGDKYDYSLGSTYTGSATYTSGSTAIPANGQITNFPNPSSDQTYTVRVFKSNCYMDFVVTIPSVYCCVMPATFTVSPTLATCTGSVPNNDAQIAVAGVVGGVKVGISTGTTYTGPAFASATALVAGAYTFTGLANPATSEEFTIRVFETADCYRDVQVILYNQNCIAPCVLPSTVTLTPTKATCTSGVANNDAQIAVTGVTGGTKAGISTGTIYTGPDFATASDLTLGAYTFTGLSNPLFSQKYTVRVYASANCYKDLQTTVLGQFCAIPCIAPTAATVVTTKATCNGTTADNDAKIAVTGVVGGDKVGYSVGIGYTGPAYASASTLISGTYTFTGIPNPTGGQMYTVRIFNGGNGCYLDKIVEIVDADCGTCQVAAAWVSGTGCAVGETNATNNNQAYLSCKTTGLIDLELTKTVSPSTGATCATTGTPFVWIVTITNKGTMTATNVNVADALPQGLTLVSATASVGSFFGGSGWNVGSLAAKASATLTLTTTALLAGTYQNCAFVNSASPENDPDSSPNNSYTANEDDDACASIAVTGGNAPSISKEFSPMLSKPNTPTRLTIKIWNNETTPITLTSALVDAFPSTPAQMVVATTPNLVVSSGITLPPGGITATAGGTSVTVPSGTILAPGLNQFSLDVTVPIIGNYCNVIAIGDLKTSAGNNCLETEGCIIANSSFDLAPVVSKTMSPAVIPVGGTATLAISIANKNASAMTLNQDFIDKLPTGLVATGTVSSSCGGASLQNGNTEVVLVSGTTIAANTTCTITVNVTSNTAGNYCNVIIMNQVLTTLGTNTNLGNQDIAEACLNVGGCIKPNAGFDQSPVCVGNTAITTATLAATAVAGGAWTQAASNPAGAVVTTPSSATSGVTGLTPGVYQFIWAISATCSDTVMITIPNCASGPVCTVSVTATPGTCAPATNQYTVSGSITFSNPPLSGTITVQVVGGANQTFTLPQTSPLNYSIGGQIADGLSHTVEVSISGVSCAGSTPYTAPAACQSVCVIADLGLIIGTCDNKGTTTDGSDDAYTFTLNPTGSGIGASYTVTGLPNSPQTGTYGSPTTFGPYLISAGAFSIAVVDDVTNTCSKVGVVNPPPSCSGCTVAPPVLTVSDNVCPSRTGSINVVQDCGAGSYLEYSTNNGLTWSTAKPLYTTTAKTILARCVNSADPSCKSMPTTVTTNPQKCPGGVLLCTLIASATAGACQDNGTADVVADDYFMLQVNASSSNAGSTKKYEVVLGADPTSGLGGNVLNSGGTMYGSPVTVGQNKQFKADGSSTYTLIVRDIDSKSCLQVINITAVPSCSALPPKSPCYPVPCVPILLNKGN